MSNTIAYVDNQTLTNIADAVRYKTGTNGKMLLSDIPDKIRNIDGIIPSGSIKIDTNGTYNITEKAEAVVDVNPDLRPLSVSENGQYSPDGFDGYSDVTVDVPAPAPVTESLSVTENGTYVPSAGVDGFDEVVVNVPTGGGGGLTLLDTIDVNGVNGVQVDIDATWFDDADFVLLVPGLTFSALDWPYIVEDSTTGGQYSGRVKAMNVEYSVVLRNTGSYRGMWYRNTTAPLLITAQSYLYWYVYDANITMTGTIKIYGIKVTA